MNRIEGEHVPVPNSKEGDATPASVQEVGNLALERKDQEIAVTAGQPVSVFDANRGAPSGNVVNSLTLNINLSSSKDVAVFQKMLSAIGSGPTSPEVPFVPFSGTTSEIAPFESGRPVSASSGLTVTPAAVPVGGSDGLPAVQLESSASPPPDSPEPVPGPSGRSPYSKFTRSDYVFTLSSSDGDVSPAKNLGGSFDSANVPSKRKNRPSVEDLSSDEDDATVRNKRTCAKIVAEFMKRYSKGKAKRAKPFTPVASHSSESSDEVEAATRVLKKQKSRQDTRKKAVASSSAGAAAGSLERDDPNKGLCAVCYVNVPNALLRCTHAFCDECLQRLRNMKRPCPKCQQTFRSFKKFHP